MLMVSVARIKKIVHADEDLATCSNNAAFVMTIATEMFVQHLVERSFEIVKAEKRGKKSLQYLDIGMYPSHLTLRYLNRLFAWKHARAHIPHQQTPWHG
jgi:histone-like transcription factor (CBF/NF-Y)